MAGNTFVHGSVVQLKTFTSDPGTATPGSMFYNITTGKFRFYGAAAWSDVTTGAISLIGQALNVNDIVIGSASNLSVAFDTTTAGQITASSINGLTINALAITNAMISASAAIARSKMASTTAYATLVNNVSGVMSEVLLTPSKAVVSDVNGSPASSTTTAVEIGYVAGVTSAIQTQLGGKANLALSNLAATAINVDLIAGVADTINLGSNTIAFLAAKANIFEIRDVGGIYGHLQKYVSGMQVIADGVDKSVQLVPTGVGTVDMSGKRVSSMQDPTSAQDGSTKNYTDVANLLLLPLSGVRPMTGNIAMGLNKVTGAAAGTAATDYVTKAQLDGVSAGLIWQLPVSDPDLIDDSLATPPVSPTLRTTYIATATAGAWTAGHAYWYNGTTWIDLLGRVVAVNDRFGVTIERGSGLEGGNLVGKHNQIATLTSVTPGAPWTFTYSFHVPVNNDAVFVNAAASTDFGHQYTYGTGLGTWVEFGGTSALVNGVGLTITGNVISVNLGAGIAALPTNEVGIDFKSNGGLWLVDPTTGLASTLTDAQLAIKLDAATLTETASGLKISAGGVTNLEVAAAAAIALTKLAATTVSRALVSDASGFIVPSTTTAIEIGYVNGVTSAIQTQINGKASLALDNLASTAVNATIQPVANLDASAVAYKNLGTAGFAWLATNAYVYKGANATQAVNISTTTGLNTVTVSSVNGIVANACSIIHSTAFPTGATVVSISGSVVTMSAVAATTVTTSAAQLLFGAIFRSEDETTNHSGQVLIRSGNSTTGATGSASLKSGDSTSGGTTGDVVISTGTTAGVRGVITANAPTISLRTDNGIYITNNANGVALLQSADYTLPASVTVFQTISTSLNFNASVYKSMQIQYEIVEAATGNCRTGVYMLAIGNVSTGDVGQNDAFASSNAALDAIELHAVVNVGTGAVDVQFKGTGANACTFKILNKIIAVATFA